MTLPHPAVQNQLLAALPKAAWLRWLPDLEAVELPLGEVLYESGGKTPYLYFPTNAIVSLLYVLEDGASAEIAVVGFEGVVGISIFMGGRLHAESGSGAKRGLGLPAAGRCGEG